MNTNSYINLTPEESKRIHNLRQMISPKFDEEAFFLSHSATALENLNKELIEIQKKIQERQRKDAEAYLSIQEELYDVHFYFHQDIFNNGGAHTILNRDQLEELLNQTEFEVYIVDLFGIKESYEKNRKTIPDWIPEKFKKMILNPEFSCWHARILEKN